MVQGRQIFTYVDTTIGVTQDGEKYLAINVMTKGSNKRKLSFVTKKEEVINKISQIKLIDFQDVNLILDFDRIYNPERKTSYWGVELIGIGNNNTNN